MTPRHKRQLDRMAALISYVAVSEGVSGDVDLEEQLLSESQRLYDIVDPTRGERHADGLTGLVEEETNADHRRSEA